MWGQATLIFGIKIYDRNGNLIKELTKKQALEDFHIIKKTGRNVFEVTDLERKQFWGKILNESEILEPELPPKPKIKIDRRKGKYRKKRPFKYKIQCKWYKCRKIVMKQSEKAIYCSFECHSRASRKKQYKKYKLKRRILSSIKFYFAIIGIATLPRT